MSAEEKTEILRFDQYRLELKTSPMGTKSRTLYRKRDPSQPLNAYEILATQEQEQEVPLEDRTLELLEYFLRNAEKELSREKIHTVVWGRPEDLGGDVNTHVTKLRKAFGDDHRRFIELLPRIGFKFLVPVKPHPDSLPASITDGPAVNTASAGAGQNDRRTDQQNLLAFEEFFGDGAASRDLQAPRGEIFVQADSIERILPEFPQMVRVCETQRAHDWLLPIPSPRDRSPVYKAPSWVNRWQTYGAFAIIERFIGYGVNPPRLYICEGALRDDSQIHSKTPFRISMGLDSTDVTTSVLSSCRAWMRVDRTEGEGVWLHEKLTRRMDKHGFVIKQHFDRYLKDEIHTAFWRPVPPGWDPHNLRAWYAWSNDDCHYDDVSDYAIILRHTEVNPCGRQVHLLLGGFTKRGTAIAAQYLAKNWLKLWKAHVREAPYYGDFLTLIEGPSNPDKTDQWSEDASFLVTPKIVHDCDISKNEWYDRVENWPKEGQEEEHSH
jgi:DNA-binding winged helix-turn-helix (wHTH) protein